MAQSNRGWVLAFVCIGGLAGMGNADNLVFFHHSVGSNWLYHSLNDALVAKSYIDEQHDITYGTVVAADSGRPDSLGSVPGDSTDMNHWILWFNDYLDHVKAFDSESGVNRIVMFKSCYPNSNIWDDGLEPGDPFSGDFTLTNFKAICRHPEGSGNTYTHDGHVYRPLEDVFAENPDTLFIPVTSPPLNYASTNNAAAQRARLFNDWLKGEWLSSYNAAHPDLHNVAVFDLFNELAYPNDHLFHPNRLRGEYGGATGDSHPNDAANAHLTAVFATNSDNFIDAAWTAFGGEIEGEGEMEGEGEGEHNGGCSSGTSGPSSSGAPFGNAAGDGLLLMSVSAVLLTNKRRTDCAEPK